ncbi:tail fiber domain-containing protein [Streptomyces sp. NPDC051576]|uniref:tail fiber domain-containing protein n=1 Tax=Streptomyces sp. NPDC051576 TaxID=3155803 RepID=UPI003427CFBF
METWRQFRMALVRLMDEGGVSPGQMLKAAHSPPSPKPDTEVPPSFTLIKRETLYGYLRNVDARVGNGNWAPIDNLLRCVEFLAEANGRPLTVDYDDWQRRWQRCDDQNASRWSETGLAEGIERRLSPDSWIGGWDGAADAVFAHGSSREFTNWPVGQDRLRALSQAVAGLGIANEPQLAKEAAERLVAGATAELGEGSPRTLAARHALAYWTGQAGHLRVALTLTQQLRADCLRHLSDDHILSRLAALREALWTGHMGRWREANRLYIATASFEYGRPDRDPYIWLLARWGMARTGGRSGNWVHAYAELTELLPSVTETFGADHPAALQAGGAHAWAAGRAGDPDEARGLFEQIADRADTALRPGHPTSMWLRISLAYWTQQCNLAAQALPAVATARERCESLLGPDHPLSIQAAEVEALFLIDVDQEAALTALSDVLERMERRYGHAHPFTLQTASNHAVVRASIEGPEPVMQTFSDLARQLGRALGDDHPETLRVRMNLVIATLGTSISPETALSDCVDVVHSLRRVLGDDHPETIAGEEVLKEIEARLRSKVHLAAPQQQSFRLFQRPEYRTGGGGSEGGGGGSDRALKCLVEPVSWSSQSKDGDRAATSSDGEQDPAGREANGFAILQAVTSMPVSTWSYRGDEDVRHLGPMAQDWYAALGLGPDDRSIHLVDVNGVSIVAIQALHRVVRSLESELNDLRARLDVRRGD